MREGARNLPAQTHDFSSVMSIYATLWALQFPRFGEFHIGCEWITVIAQSVPAHVGAEARAFKASVVLANPPLTGSPIGWSVDRQRDLD
jgi:hypothetical protein